MREVTSTLSLPESLADSATHSHSKALAPKFDGYATKYGSDSFKFYRADINEHEVGLLAFVSLCTAC